jgi:hypothetical protein
VVWKEASSDGRRTSSLAGLMILFFLGKEKKEALVGWPREEGSVLWTGPVVAIIRLVAKLC